jgi:beta-phosphoglucomutase
MTLLAPGLALIFDMDGVVIDSNPDHTATWVEFNRGYGIETTPEMLQRMYGKRNDWIVRDFYGDDLPEDEVFRRGAAKEQLYRDRIEARLDGLLVPGIREFLEEYGNNPIALATNAEPANVNFVLDRAGLRQFFRAVVDGHQVEKPKPDPEVYVKAAGLLGVEPRNCIVFEDSLSGVAAARAAAMKVIGVCTTHVYLPGTSITVDNFMSRALRSWLHAQVSVA